MDTGSPPQNRRDLRAAQYLRMSTASADSLDNQAAVIARYAEANGWEFHRSNV